MTTKLKVKSPFPGSDRIERGINLARRAVNRPQTMRLLTPKFWAEVRVVKGGRR